MNVTDLATAAALDGTPGVLVRAVPSDGTVSGPPIETAVVLADGRRAGTALDGRLDHDVDDVATRRRDATLLEAAELPVVDGGAATLLLIQPLAQLPGRYWAPGDRPDVAVTLLDGNVGATAVVTADRHVIGTLGDPDLDRRAVAQADRVLRAARTTATVLRLGADHRALLEVRRRSSTLIVAGVSELADATAAIARTLGWTVHCADDPDVVCRLLDRCTAGDALVVMSHDPALDEPVLAHAATRPLGYVGVLGSRRVHADRHARLRRRGLDEAFLRRLRGPAGLDLGAWTPQETALSLLAEIVAVRGGGSGRPLTEIADAIHR